MSPREFKTSPRGLKRALRGFKSAPRGSQEGSRGFKRVPRGLQEGLKRSKEVSRGFRELPRGFEQDKYQENRWVSELGGPKGPRASSVTHAATKIPAEISADNMMHADAYNGAFRSHHSLRFNLGSWGCKTMKIIEKQ